MHEKTSQIFRNSETKASEFIENLEEKVTHYWYKLVYNKQMTVWTLL